MPTYEYRCENGHEFEEFQSIVSEPLRVCPICQGRAERRISGGTGLIFKGSGFYITDYSRKGANSTGEKASDSAKAKSESAPAKSETSSDSTPSKKDD
jgi:putative FmdB family regulatory protein